MITTEQYNKARDEKEAAQKTIDEYHKQRRDTFAKRMSENPIFTDDELHYSAETLCPCGHGLAYSKECGPDHYWDCSAILKGIADKGVEHTGKLPFAMYSIKGESEHRGTTRGVFKPRP